MNVETASRLANLRKRSGLSQEELAEKVGVSRQAVSKWERAESSPDTSNLIALAKVYGVKVDDMLNMDTPQGGDIGNAASADSQKFNWASFPYPVIVTIVFFLLIFDVIPVNFPEWLVFLTIPIWAFFFTKGKGDKKKQKRNDREAQSGNKESSYEDWMNE